MNRADPVQSNSFRRLRCLACSLLHAAAHGFVCGKNTAAQLDSPRYTRSGAHGLPAIDYEQHPGAATAPLAHHQYQRHEPEKMVLYQIVQENLETFLARPSFNGGQGPRFIEREFQVPKLWNTCAGFFPGSVSDLRLRTTGCLLLQGLLRQGRGHSAAQHSGSGAASQEGRRDPSGQTRLAAVRRGRDVGRLLGIAVHEEKVAWVQRQGSANTLPQVPGLRSDQAEVSQPRLLYPDASTAQSPGDDRRARAEGFASSASSEPPHVERAASTNG